MKGYNDFEPTSGYMTRNRPVYILYIYIYDYEPTSSCNVIIYRLVTI